MPGRDGTGPRATIHGADCSHRLGLCHRGEGQGRGQGCRGRGAGLGCHRGFRGQGGQGSLRERRAALQRRIEEIDRLLATE